MPLSGSGVPTSHPPFCHGQFGELYHVKGDRFSYLPNWDNMWVICYSTLDGILVHGRCFKTVAHVLYEQDVPYIDSNSWWIFIELSRVSRVQKCQIANFLFPASWFPSHVFMWMSLCYFFLYSLFIYWRLIAPSTAQGHLGACQKCKSGTRWTQYKTRTLYTNIKHINIIRKLVPSVLLS